MQRFRNERKRAQRRSFGVSAYIGANGGGKSACMVWDALPSLQAGRAVLSTVRIQDFEDPRPCDDDYCGSNPGVLDHFKMRPTEAGRAALVRNAKAQFFYGPGADLEPVEMESTGVHLAAHPGWIPWNGWQQLLDMRFGEVLADEMTGIAESRQALSLPTVVVNQFQQLRRADIPFRYTTPAWERADVSLRQPTQTVTVCRGFLKKEAPMDGDQGRLWRASRLFRWATYDAMALTALTEGKRAELRPEVRDWHWGPGSPAWAAYDTFAPVLQVGTVTEGGRCHKCGGKREHPKCSCEPSVQTARMPARGRRARRGPLPAATQERGQGAADAPTDLDPGDLAVLHDLAGLDV